MTKNSKIEFEAAAFRQLLEHLQQHTEVQNIDLMILADFCRNCLAKWYAAAAQEQGEEISYEEAREIASYLNDNIKELAYTVTLPGEMHGRFVVREFEEGMVGLAVKSRAGDEEPALA